MSIFAAFAFVLFLAPAVNAQQVDPKTYGGMKWRLIGPFRGGRAIAVTGVPSQPNTFYFGAVAGGVWRSTDGGMTWDPLFDKQTTTSSIGAIDVSDPQNPHILFAAMWEGYRTPWSLNSGGAKDGLYRSSDDGATWKPVEGNGLPEGPLGRISVSVSGADSNVVYALIEAKKGGLYRSDDGGGKWSLISDDHRFRQRAWYFTHVCADPKNVNTVYIAHTGLFRSVDGGKTWDRLNAPHGDHHGLWVDPRDSNRMINGNDGGATISVGGGKNWTKQCKKPTA